MIVKPAYSRDYKSKEAVMKDWDDNKDFIIDDINSEWNGKYVNKEQVKDETVTFRYNNLRKTFSIMVD
jgi:hypothetical protein